MTLKTKKQLAREVRDLSLFGNDRHKSQQTPDYLRDRLIEIRKLVEKEL